MGFPAFSQPLITMTQITTSTTFQERMFERVKESLSELLTPEEAKSLVERVIAQDLLTETVIPSQPYYGGRNKTIPSKFNQLVSEQIDPIVKQCVEEWISDNENIVLELINRTLEQGILSACASALSYQLQEPLATLRGDITNVLTKLGGV